MIRVDSHESTWYDVPQTLPLITKAQGVFPSQGAPSHNDMGVSENLVDLRLGSL